MKATRDLVICPTTVAEAQEAQIQEALLAVQEAQVALQAVAEDAGVAVMQVQVERVVQAQTAQLEFTHGRR